MTHEELTELLAHIKALFDAQKPVIIKGIDDKLDSQTSDITKGISEMFNAQTSDLKTMIENGVQKDIRQLIDKVSAMNTRMDNIGKDLAEMKEDMAVVREAVTNQDSVFYQVRRIDS